MREPQARHTAPCGCGARASSPGHRQLGAVLRLAQRRSRALHTSWTAGCRSSATFWSLRPHIRPFDIADTSLEPATTGTQNTNGTWVAHGATAVPPLLDRRGAQDACGTWVAHGATPVPFLHSGCARWAAPLVPARDPAPRAARQPLGSGSGRCPSRRRRRPGGGARRGCRRARAAPTGRRRADRASPEDMAASEFVRRKE